MVISSCNDPELHISVPSITAGICGMAQGSAEPGGAVRVQTPCPRGPAVPAEEEEEKRGTPSPLLCTGGSAARGPRINPNPVRGSGSIAVCRNRSSALALADIESSRRQGNGTF